MTVGVVWLVKEHQEPEATSPTGIGRFGPFSGALEAKLRAKESESMTLIRQLRSSSEGSGVIKPRWMMGEHW